VSSTPYIQHTRRGQRLERKAILEMPTIEEALAVIDRSGLAPALQRLAECTPEGKRRRGRPRSIPKVRGLLTAFMINGATQGHTARIIEVNRWIHCMTPEQRRQLDLPYDSRHTYDHLQRFLTWLAATLKAAPEVEIDGQTVRLDQFQFMNRLIEASTATDLPHPEYRSVAADDTAVETWAAIYGNPEGAVLNIDDDGSGYGLPENEAGRKRARQKLQTSKLQIRGFTETGKPIYTHDPDALASYATATNSRAGHKFIGYHLYLAVATKAVSGSDGREELTLGPAVPELVLGAHLAPAGSHRGEALVEILGDIKRRHPKVDEVICDKGYTGAKPHRFFHPVRQLGFDVVFEPNENQRGIWPFDGKAFRFDGGFYSELMPRALQGYDERGNRKPLSYAHWKEGTDARARDEAIFNDRAKYAFRRHSRPDADGAIRLRCPFHGGRLRSLQVPHSMKAGHHVPLVVLDGGSDQRCCDNSSGVITVSADDALLFQTYPFGTTAWRKAYARKNSAENANSALKGKYTNIEAKYTQVLGVEKNAIFLAFALAGYNLDRLKAWQYRIESDAAPRARRKRRDGTWHNNAAA
jgi:hypothetical protein